MKKKTKILSVYVNHVRKRSWFGLVWRQRGNTVIFRRTPPIDTLISVSYATGEGWTHTEKKFVGK